MPSIRPPRPRRAPPRPSPQKEASPFHVSRPEWDGEGELPNLREKDTISLLWGGTIEHTLNKSAHPLDCEAWPGSPYCDIASTFDWGNIAGVGIDISATPCGVAIRATPTLFWLNMAPATVVYRRDAPECQPEVPHQGLPPFQANSKGFVREHFGCFGCIYRLRLRTSVPPGNGDSGISNVPPATENDLWVDFFGPLEGFEAFSYTWIELNGVQRWGAYLAVWAHGYATSYPTLFGNPDFPKYSPTGDFVNVWGWGFSPFFEEKEISWQIVSLELVDDSMEGAYNGFDPNIRFKRGWNLANCKGCSQRPPPPLPYLPQENMCNCKQIEKDLKQIKRLLGADKGGWKLPKSLAGRGTEQVSHDNYADLMVWFAGQMSTLLGDTEIVITQKDSSLLEEGNQERQLKFENLAEAMADALGLLLENQAKVDAIYRAAAQGLAQAGVAATSAAKGLEYLEDLVDFLDYETEEKSFDFPLFFTPDKDAPHEALKPSTAKLVYQSFTGKRSFNSFRFTMEQCAAIIRAVYWQRVDDDSMTRFKGSLNALRQNANSENEGELDTFLERIEQGFPEVPGNVDQSQPYGAPYSQRPKIRKLSQGGQPDGSNP